MQVIVFGGTRFMGKHLVEELIREGHDITLATRGNTPDPYGDSVKRIKLDRCDPESLKENLPDTVFDVVFDSLAYCSDDVVMLLDKIKCRRYVQISTTAVYEPLKDGSREEDFDPHKKELVSCKRADFSYAEVKRQAECAIVQRYPELSAASVRFPFVIGEDDYTGRLYFYVEHIVNGKAMFVDNFTDQMAFIFSDEAGKLLAFLGGIDFTGAVNGADSGTISIKDISDYVKAKTGKEAILSENGDKAPYNGFAHYYINTERAEKLGFHFAHLKDRIYDLLDCCISRANLC